ncbi:hypothetical protein L1987_13727 [Smallanthus sonchifolius]|uniref:Uncharacterized protein n=1 Tax=Smallanthus sonchifolius TaxID=185202 RepID=A0ACB9JK14_9ASTR|nr:hypothetical protein L1987_13727 [Smallanthus sonchifolius]
MVATKGAGGNGAGAGASLTNLIQPITAECCMCGDYGLSQELFRCKICKSRFQHKYCSNQYPKAELYKACNWCLHDSGNMSSSCKHNSGDDRRHHAVKNKRNPNDLISTGLIKKLHGPSPEEDSPGSTCRKRVAGGVVLRKSKSANHLSNGGGNGNRIKPVFRNKVRRYKLLDEVSSQ